MPVQRPLLSRGIPTAARRRSLPVRPAFFLPVLLGMLVSLSSCTTERIVVVERPVPVSAPEPTASGVPAVRLEVALERFLATLLAGGGTDLLLAGDRFVVVTPVDLREVTSLRARGDVRMIAVGVPGSCPGGCTVLLGEVVAALRDDLAAADASAAVVLADPPLETWPTLEVWASSRRWRVSFDETGRRLFVVELLAGTVTR